MPKLIAGNLEVFADNIETEFKMDCCNCNNTFDKQFSVGDIDNYEKEKGIFAKEAFKEGWRYSASTVFGHTGIHCPECHKHRNNKKHWD